MANEKYIPTPAQQAGNRMEELEKLIQRHASAYVTRGHAISDSIIAECKASREALLAFFAAQQPAAPVETVAAEPDYEIVKAGDDAYRACAGGAHYAGMDGITSAYRAMAKVLVDRATKSAPSLRTSQHAELLPKREPAGGGADTNSSAETDGQAIASIVSRLRNFAVWNNRHSHYEPVPLCKEAADLIERISGETALKLLESQAQQITDGRTIYDAAHRENERLRAALRQILTAAEDGDEMTAVSMAEAALKSDPLSPAQPQTASKTGEA